MGFLEDWAVRSIRAFEAAGLTVAVDTGDGRESRAAAWAEGYAASQEDWETAVADAIAFGTGTHPMPDRQASPNPYRATVQ